MKTCSHCETLKSLDKFSADKRNKDGLQGICRACKNTCSKNRCAERIETGDYRAVTEKKCNSCAEVKLVHLFFRDRAMGDGYAAVCKVCKTASTMRWRKEKTEVYNAYMQKYRSTHPAKYAAERERSLRNRYAITPTQYDEMLVAQNGTCALCEYRPNGRPLYIDHHHATGKVRGLLCPSHNRSIAILDDPELLIKAMAYIKKYAA